MPEETHNFASTRARLEEIVTQVRKKDTSLEASLDLLEEGVRLANQCTELIDHADWEAGEVGSPEAEVDLGDEDEAATHSDDGELAHDTVAAEPDENESSPTSGD